MIIISIKYKIVNVLGKKLNCTHLLHINSISFVCIRCIWKSGKLNMKN